MLNKLTIDELRGADKLFARLLILFGYIVSMGMALDPSGWDDPVFQIVRRIPFTPYSWALALALGTTVYTVGELMKDENRWRGRLIIGGALLCASWWLAMGLGMARMVYIMPTRITDLWPLVAGWCCCLYIARVIVYSNAFSGRRWSTNPYQLWDTTFLMLASISQIIIGIAPGSVFMEIERPVALQLGVINFVGAAVVMFGLHLKDEEVGLNLEFAGAFSLVATLGLYCVTVLQHQPLSGTTLGFSMPEAFVFATFHRAVQIFVLNAARWFDKPRLENRMLHALNPAERAVDAAKPKHGR